MIGEDKAKVLFVIIAFYNMLTHKDRPLGLSFSFAGSFILNHFEIILVLRISRPVIGI